MSPRGAITFQLSDWSIQVCAVTLLAEISATSLVIGQFSRPRLSLVEMCFVHVEGVSRDTLRYNEAQSDNIKAFI